MSHNVTRTVDVAIIGAGSAGLSARREVIKQNKSYVVIDDGPLGTTCARVGCMPSKVLIQVAKDYHRRHAFDAQGIHGGEALSIDRREAMAHVRGLRDYFTGFVKDGIGSWSETHLIRARAKFLDGNTLQAGSEIIRAGKIIIATGSSPILPGPWREYAKDLVTTDQFFELDTLPEKMAVIGLGVIGIELGQAISRLGVDVVGISLDKSIGGLSHPDLQDYAVKTFENEMKLVFGAADIIGRGPDGGVLVSAGGDTYAVDKVLLSLGRAPNLGSLGLDDIGLINPPEKRIPDFATNTMRVTGTDIYIAGDVNGDRPLLHEAADEGRIAGFNAARDEDTCFQRRMPLAVTFSDPEIAIVGETYRSLNERGADFVTGEVSFEGQGRARIMSKNKGHVHIYADRQTGKILGTEMISPSADHFAHLFALIITTGLTVRDVLSLPFYHPVLEEGLRTAFRDAATKLETPPGDMELLYCAEPPVGACPDVNLTDA